MKPVYDYEGVVMPRNTRYSRDSKVAAATFTDVAAGAEAPPRSTP